MPAPSALFLAHLRHPARGGRFREGEAGEDRVVQGEARAAAGERRVRLALRVAGDGVLDARFQAFGCAATLACASFLADRAAGSSFDDLEPLRAADLAAALELDAERAPAADLALEALRRALAAARDPQSARS